MTKAAFSADYVDLRFIKSRKVAQIVVEIAIEQAVDFVAAFGTPNPESGVPVAIARLNSGAPASEAAKPADEPSSKERRKFNTLPLAQQAAMRCQDTAFRHFIAERESRSPDSVTNDIAADRVRQICGVTSRSDIVYGTDAGRKWDQLNCDYEFWMRHNP